VAISTGVGAGVAAGVAAGAMLGLVNGFVVAVGRVNGLIATIAGAIIFAGVAQVLAGQNLLTPASHNFAVLGTDSVLGVYYSIWILLLMVVFFGALLSLSRFGRAVQVVGANAEVARLSGLRVSRVRCLTYVLSGVAAGAAGVLAVSQSGQAQATIGGTPYVLSVIAAIAVGGTSLRGGRGSIGRTAVGVLFLGLVTNGLGLLNVNPLYDQFFTGIIILAAVAHESRVRRGSRSTL
jgi:ribose/xylose/arabinose/galactoside ABC-type transport system permease subunit